MASLESIKMLLNQLRAKITAHPAFGKFDGGPTVDDSAYNRDWEELNSIGQKLGLALRELKQKENLTQTQVKNALRGPLDQRFRATSIQGGAHDLRMITEMARSLRSMLEDMVRRYGKLGKAETAKQLAEFIEKIYKQTHVHTGTVDVSHELRYTPYHPQSEASIEGLVLPIFMLIQVIDYLRKKFK